MDLFGDRIELADSMGGSDQDTGLPLAPDQRWCDAAAASQLAVLVEGMDWSRLHAPMLRSRPQCYKRRDVLNHLCMT
jgi:hypothetical protein